MDAYKNPNTTSRRLKIICRKDLRHDSLHEFIRCNYGRRLNDGRPPLPRWCGAFSPGGGLPEQPALMETAKPWAHTSFCLIKNVSCHGDTKQLYCTVFPNPTNKNYSKMQRATWGTNRSFLSWTDNEQRDDDVVIGWSFLKRNWGGGMFHHLQEGQTKSFKL